MAKYPEKSMKKVSRNRPKSYLFESKMPPALAVKPGERFLLETEDNFTGFVTSDASIPSLENLAPHSLKDPPEFYPLCGPVSSVIGNRTTTVLKENFQ